MRIIDLSLSGYRQFAESMTLTMPEGLIGVCGPNGVGKSKIVEAIGYALYGPTKQVLPRGDLAADLAARGQAGAVPTVELVLEIGGQIYHIHRSARGASIRLAGAAEPVATTPKGVNQKVIELVRLTCDAYHATFIARQREISALQNLPSTQRQMVVNRLIGVTQVEKAILLARERRLAAVETLRARREVPGTTPEEALKQLAACETARMSADAIAARHKGTLESAREAHDHRLAELTEIKSRAERVVGLQRTLVSADGEHEARATGHADAGRRVKEVQAAAEQLSARRSELAATCTAADDVTRWDEIAKRSEYVTEERRLRLDLERRLHPLAAKRDAAYSASRLKENLIKELERERDTYSTAKALAEQEAARSTQAAAKGEQRKATIEKLGPTEPCDMCGQPLGDSLPQAVAHLMAEIAAARGRKDAALKEAWAAHNQEEAVGAKIALATRELAELASHLTRYERIPGELAQAEEALECARDTLRVLPISPDLDVPYDEAAHTAAVAAARLHVQAAQAIVDLEPRAAKLPEAQDDEHVRYAALEQSAAECARLRAEILQETPTLDALPIAEECLVTATVALRATEFLVQTAEKEAVAAELEITAARKDLVRAQERHQLITEAQRNAGIAERAETLLRRIVEDIAGEARPRLEEMLDGWARALLGPRFRSIALTPDYHIQADNGSGLHGIEHFSGGEQTLLSVMLRIAISIYCRERAGFEPGFLILDEVFGDQDSEHRGQLVQFLREIKDSHRQILVINHIEDVTDTLDTIIDVVPLSNLVSVARLRR